MPRLKFFSDLPILGNGMRSVSKTLILTLALACAVAAEKKRKAIPVVKPAEKDSAAVKPAPPPGTVATAEEITF